MDRRPRQPYQRDRIQRGDSRREPAGRPSAQFQRQNGRQSNKRGRTVAEAMPAQMRLKAVLLCAFLLVSGTLGLIIQATAGPSVDLSTLPQTLLLGEGEQYSLFAGKERSGASAYSSDPGIVEIEGDKLNAKAVGNATVTVSAAKNDPVQIAVEVKEAPQSIELTAENNSMACNSTMQLQVKFDENSASGTMLYQSSNDAVISVDENGLVTAKTAGSATITSTAYNGATASVDLTVSVVDYTKPYTSETLAADVKTLGESYPDLIQVSTVGQSVQGKDIYLMKLGKGEKKALIVAGIHANEYIATTFTMRCVEEYAQAYYSSSGKYGTYDLRGMLEKYTLYIIPSGNPDGLDIATGNGTPEFTVANLDTIYDDYTTNANGVNLNHNYPYQWDVVSQSLAANHEISKACGTSAGSEPETQIVMQLCEENEFEWLFSMHCQGNCLYWRDAGNGAVEGDYTIAYRLNTVCGMYLCEVSQDANFYGGGMENWFRSAYDRPGFCVELMNTGAPRSEYFTKFEEHSNWEKTKYIFIQGMRGIS